MNATSPDWRRSIAPASLLLALAGCASDPGGDEPDPTAEGSTSAASSDGEIASSGDPDDDGSTGEEPGRVPTDPPPQPEAWEWELPPGFPVPYVPPENPMSAAKVELGRHLFYDERLSINGTVSCASCHQQELAFTDGGTVSVGATGEQTSRGSMSLANVAYASTLGWGNPTLLALEAHAVVPLFGDDPLEMGVADEAQLVGILAEDSTYLDLFELAYPEQAQPITLQHAVGSLASFQRTLISGGSPFDRWFYEGDETAISEDAKRGYDLFHHPFGCFYCHFSFNFTDAVFFEDLPELTTPFHNIGLYNLDAQGSYPQGNTGLHAHTGDPADMGKFKAPTLRNIMVTGPYMHDGSIETIEQVLAHYAAGGRTIAEGPNAGVGADNPHKDSLMGSFELEAHQIADAVALFESLTDSQFLEDPRFSNPWE